MAWTTVADVRLITGLTTSDISDADLTSLIAVAQKEVLLVINNKVTREKVEYIDETRKNEIDGTNTTYYIRNWDGNFISDANYDLDVTTSDITLISVGGDGIESSVTISTVSSSAGSYVVSSAQSDVSLYVSYVYSMFDPVTPDPLLKLATEFLAASYAYMRIDSSQKKKVKFGNVSIENSTGSDSASMVFYNKYLDILRQLNENAGIGAIWGDSLVKI